MSPVLAAFVQPGDRIYIKVWMVGQQQTAIPLTDSIYVDERGNVLLPKVGTVHVTTLHVGDVADSLRSRFGEFLQGAPVEVIPLRRVVANGALIRPGVYWVDARTKIGDLIARAGGPTGDANANQVVVVRKGESRRVDHWQEDRSESSDLYSGDEVVVGRRSWLQLNIFNVISTTLVVAGLIMGLVRR